MQLDTVIRANKSLGVFTHHADQLWNFEFPVLFGRSEARKRATILFTQAANDAEASANLLRSTGYRDQVIQPLRDAAQRIRMTKPSQRSTHELSRVLIESVATVKKLTAHAHQDESPAIQAAGILMKKVHDVESDEWRILSRLLRADLEGSAINMPNKSRAMITSNLSSHYVGGSRYKDAWSPPDNSIRTFEEAQGHFDAWAARNDPDLKPKIALAIEQALSGRITNENTELLARIRNDVDYFTREFSPLEQEFVRTVAFGPQHLTYRKLNIFRSFVVSGLDSSSELDPFRRKILELIDKSLAKQERHYIILDNAEIGKRRATILLIQSMVMDLYGATKKSTAPAASTPHSSKAPELLTETRYTW